MKGVLIILLLNLIPTITFAQTNMHTTIQQVKEKHQAEIMSLPGVVSVGIGLYENETVIIVGMDSKNPEIEKKLPKELEGYKVIVQTVGKIKAQ